MESINADHRPWPLPDEPWMLKQTWEDLLFAHWEIPPSLLQGLVPSELKLDTYDGRAWIGVIPFGINGMRLRLMPPIPGVSVFPQLNVRTYVTRQGKPGVYFFSLDAANTLAVAAARRFFHLPYYRAEMQISRNTNEVTFTSSRTHRNAPPAEFSGSYAPNSEVEHASVGSLESWLVERYCLYTLHGGNVYRGEIHHERWPLQRAEADIHYCTMTASSQIELPDTMPLLHYARKLDALMWPLRQC